MQSFTGVLVVAAVAFGVDLALGLVPRLPVPAVALEIVAGIVLGPSVLGWAHVDDAVALLALVGLAFLLLLAGLELDFDRLRGQALRLAAVGFAVSFVLALAAGALLRAGGLIRSPVLVAIALAATSLGIVIPVLKDTRTVDTTFGQLVIAGASLADIATIVLLSLLFAEHSSRLSTKLLLLGLFAGLVVVSAAAILLAERWQPLGNTLERLQDTSAQIRVRGAFLLLAAFVVLAQKLGLEAILGAFMAGAIIKLVDRDVMMTHPLLRTKLEAAGFGIFVPFFFVSSGLRFDGHALFASASTVARVPLFVAALLVARALPALVYRSLLGTREIVAAGLLQATSLGFLVVVAMIGSDLGLVSAANGAALVAAGLVSVLVFPAAALALVRDVSSPA
jgi:Kef-type K+ transport system membrane component KefB